MTDKEADVKCNRPYFEIAPCILTFTCARSYFSRGLPSPIASTNSTHFF